MHWITFFVIVENFESKKKIQGMQKSNLNVLCNFSREKKNRILSAPTKIYFPFERFNSLLFPLSPLCPLTLPLLPWKTQFLASVKSQRTIENAHDQSIYFLVYFRITKVRGRNLRGIFMAWRTIHQVIKPDESFSFNIEHYPRTQIKIVARRILKL